MGYKGAGGSNVRRILQAELDLSNAGNPVSFVNGDNGAVFRLITVGKFNTLIFAAAVKLNVANPACSIGLPTDLPLAGDSNMDVVGIANPFFVFADSDDLNNQSMHMAVDGSSGRNILFLRNGNTATGAGVNFATGPGGTNVRGELSWFSR